MRRQTYDILPTSVKEVNALGWDGLDVIIFTGDAYIDHPSFGAALIGRVLLAAGYQVAIVPQPNWQDDLRDFRKLGAPRLFFGVTAGAMDSMVNHYTATRRLRSNDAYTPAGRTGMRPDYPTIVYTQILKRIYPDVPVVLGGIEASLRRLTHYDYWQDRIRPSFLVESGADMIAYGMGEKTVIEIAKAIAEQRDWRKIKQIAYLGAELPSESHILMHPFEECRKDKHKYGENFVKMEEESNKMEASMLVEPVGKQYVIINPPYTTLNESEIDASFDLPYSRLPHPRYYGRGEIPAYEMIKNSVNIHRGCFGGCSFCTISAHQGKFVASRSKKSIIEEVKKITKTEGFHGTISDIGGPSANMWRMRGRDTAICSKCKRPSCIFPKVCANLDNNHKPIIELYREIRSIDGVKHCFIGSGIRYDMFDKESDYLREVLKFHTGGRFKVAPEHTEDKILNLMRKPSFSLFDKLNKEFKKICSEEELPYQLIPYFISAHPGCREQDMQTLAGKVKGLNTEQVQDFTPTPMTLSTTIYYTGFNPYTGEEIYTAKSRNDKNRQKSYFFNSKKYDQKSGRHKRSYDPNQSKRKVSDRQNQTSRSNSDNRRKNISKKSR